MSRCLLKTPARLLQRRGKPPSTTIYLGGCSEREHRLTEVGNITCADRSRHQPPRRARVPRPTTQMAWTRSHSGPPERGWLTPGAPRHNPCLVCPRQPSMPTIAAKHKHAQLATPDLHCIEQLRLAQGGTGGHRPAGALSGAARVDLGRFQVRRLPMYVAQSHESILAWTRASYTCVITCG